MRMLKFASVALVCVAVAIAISGLTSCGSNRGSVREDGRIVIDYWEKWTNFEKEAMQRIVDAYNESQDEVWVNFVSQSSLERKLLLATSGGNPPDVSGFWSYALPSFVDMGALQPLDRRMEESGLSRDDYVPSIYAQCYYRDHTWGLPTTPASIALHYNQELLADHGVDPASLDSIDALVEASKKLTKTGEDGRYVQMGFLPVDPGWWTPMWSFWFGDPLVSADGRELTCDSPETLASLRWFASFTKDYDYEKMRLFEAAHRGQFASSSNSFMSGRVAMKLQGVWMASFIDTFGPDMKWGAAPFPAGFDTGGEPVTVVETDLLVIPRGAKHPEEAWDFIQFVQQQKQMEQLCLAQFKFSPLREVSDEFNRTHPNKEITMFRKLAESKNAVGAPQIPIWTEYRDELGAAYQRLWTDPDGADPEELMKRVKDRLQPRLDQANRTWDRVRDKRLAEWEVQ